MDEDKNWKPLVKKMDDQVNTHSFEIVMKLASPAGGHHCTQVAIALLTMPSLVQIFVHPKFYADEILSIRKKGCQDSERHSSPPPPPKKKQLETSVGLLNLANIALLIIDMAGDSIVFFLVSIFSEIM